MNYALDIAAVLTVLLCVVFGRRRGAVCTLIYIAGCAAAFASAVLVSNAADEYIYDRFIKKAVISAIESRTDELADKYLSPEGLGKALSENGIDLTYEQLAVLSENSENYSDILTDEQIRVTLNSMFTNYCRALTEAFSGVVPDDIAREAEKYLDEAEMGNAEKLRLLTEEKESLAEIAEREIIRPVMLKTVKAALFALTFAVVMTAAVIAAKAAGIIRAIPAVRKADGFLGGILGFIQALIITVVLCVGVSAFINITSDANRYINTNVISETYLFRYLCSGTVLLLSLIFIH